MGTKNPFTFNLDPDTAKAAADRVDEERGREAVAAQMLRGEVRQLEVPFDPFVWLTCMQAACDLGQVGTPVGEVVDYADGLYEAYAARVKKGGV
jgi:hypothetical protein